MARDDRPEAIVQAYIEAFNHDDCDAMAACFAEDGMIFDGMAPHLWRGRRAARDWFRDVRAEGEHVGAADYRASLGQPSHDQVSGDWAYLSLPAELRFTLQGRPITQTGATMTFALKREAGEWRIAAWAWAKGKVG